MFCSYKIKWWQWSPYIPHHHECLHITKSNLDISLLSTCQPHVFSMYQALLYNKCQFFLLLSITMLFLLLVYYLVQGAFIDMSLMPSIDGHSLDTNHCTNLAHFRTIWNIMWSCLATIFSCTWVTIHPNIPCPKKWNPVILFAEHHLPLFICALPVPEYVLAWAIRQFLRVWEIAKQNKGEFKI